MRVFMLKEGKESGQGVGYLDDGTMVVVDQGRKALGKTIEVTVTSVLQTTAGKMIFCRWLDAPAPEEGSRKERSAVERRDPRNGREYRGPERREVDRRTEHWAVPAGPVPTGPVAAAAAQAAPLTPSVAPLVASVAPLGPSAEAARSPEEAVPPAAEVASRAAKAD
jgi:hypothetical protein